MTNMRKLWVNVEVMVHETKSYNFEKEISRIAFEKKNVLVMLVLDNLPTGNLHGGMC